MPLLLDCGDIIWEDRGNLTLIQHLQALKNKAARSLLGRPFYSSGPGSLSELSWDFLTEQDQVTGGFSCACASIISLLISQFPHVIYRDFYDRKFKNNMLKKAGATGQPPIFPQMTAFGRPLPPSPPPPPLQPQIMS